MSTNPEISSKNQKYTDSQVQRMILYYCLRTLMLKRINAGKNFGKTFMQKAVQKMQEFHVPKLEKYFYTVDRIACSYSPGLQNDYDKLESAGYFENNEISLELIDQVKNELTTIYGPEFLKKIDDVTESIKNTTVENLKLQSDKKETDEIRCSTLFYFNPKATPILNLRNMDLENEIKEKWLSNLGFRASIPTANPISIRKGNIQGIVKATGFFVLKDYLTDSKGENGRIIALFGDSRQDINQSCLCLIDKEITVQALRQYENELPECKFLVIGRVVKNPCLSGIKVLDNSETTNAKFSLEALAVLQSVVGIHTVITSSDKCAQEIKHYAKKDSFGVSTKVSSMLGEFKRINPRIKLAVIRDFCKNEIKDSKIHPPEHLQAPMETLTTRKGDCKAKVCLAYSMLITQTFIESAELVFLNVDADTCDYLNGENVKPNHVQLEVRMFGDPTPIRLELTEIDGASYREVGRVALPLYTIRGIFDV
jgi:hypothetical protein